MLTRVASLLLFLVASKAAVIAAQGLRSVVAPADEDLNLGEGFFGSNYGEMTNITEWDNLNGSSAQRRVLTHSLLPPCNTLGSEYTRHGMPESDMQTYFDHLAGCGYMLHWINGYSVGGSVYYNHIWVPGSGIQWKMYYGKTLNGLKTTLDQQKGTGFEPVHLDSYLKNGSVRYALILHKNAPGWWRLKYNLSQSQHQSAFDQAKADGLKARCISVVSVNGVRRWSALYRSTNIGSWRAKSSLKQSAYQAEFDFNKAAGRFPIYLDGYKHGSQNYISAIFASKPSTLVRANHGLSSDSFQLKFDDNTGDGYSTQIVTGIDNGSHNYHAVWRK